MTHSHRPIMLKECLESIVFTDAGIYLDCTFGAGGHSGAILARMSQNSLLYAFDSDADASERARQLASTDDRLRFERANFVDLAQLCAKHDLLGRVNAVMADLGVSSPQLDEAHRGFSFRYDAPLDMRLDTRTTPDARQWINRCSTDELRSVFRVLGQLRRPGALARAIDKYRRKNEIVSTVQLANLVAAVEPTPKSRRHPATNVFRAIRMHINNEIDNLVALLDSAAEILVQGGRLLLICFHSLEVRALKSALDTSSPRKLPVQEQSAAPWRLLSKHRPRVEEIAENPRARSACLYVVEKR